MFEQLINPPIVQIFDSRLDTYGVELFIKREDLTDPFISGNKFRKLKYNLIYAKENGHNTLLTFGGAYSNHIHAVAYAGNKFGFKTIGIIRGEQTLPLNPTLEDAASFGMDFHYVSRRQYHDKADPSFTKALKNKFGDFYMIPEGGSNALAVKGCTEILYGSKGDYDHFCCACGTGGTIAGIIASLNGSKKIWGFPALKNGGFLKDDISHLLTAYGTNTFANWSIITDYHFGGYAKYTYDLIAFINRFKKNHDISLDPVYTGKLLFGIYDCAKRGIFKQGEKVLAIHTGGIQGIRGFNERFGNLIN